VGNNYVPAFFLSLGRMVLIHDIREFRYTRPDRKLSRGSARLILWFVRHRGILSQISEVTPHEGNQKYNNHVVIL